MADQTLAESKALSGPHPKRRRKAETLLYWLARGWRARACWARYMLTGGRVGVPQLVDFVVGNRFFVAMQVRDELIALGEILACQCPERALEIGTAEGGTLFFLSRLASPRATILSVDLPGGQFGGGYDALRAWCYRRFARSRQRLTLLQGDSHTNEMLNRVKAALRGQTLDYLFIDGDHTYEGVKRDFELYGPLVRKGGIIALHDIADHPTPLGCEVSRFWNEVKPQRPHIELVADRGQRWAGIGVLNVE